MLLLYINVATHLPYQHHLLYTVSFLRRYLLIRRLGSFIIAVNGLKRINHAHHLAKRPYI
jgi:hypothetical protein